MLVCLSFYHLSLSSCFIYIACEVIFRGNTSGFKNGQLAVSLCFLVFSPFRVFSPSCHFCCGKFPVMYSFPLRVYKRHGTCPEILGSPVMWWIYIFKNNPHRSDYEHNSNLKFCCWWWWLYIFLSVQQCTVTKTFPFYRRLSFLWICCLCSTCCTETFQRNQEIPLSQIFFFFLFVLSQLSFPANVLWALLILSLLK